MPGSDFSKRGRALRSQQRVRIAQLPGPAHHAQPLVPAAGKDRERRGQAHLADRHLGQADVVAQPVRGAGLARGRVGNDFDPSAALQLGRDRQDVRELVLAADQ